MPGNADRRDAMRREGLGAEGEELARKKVVLVHRERKNERTSE